MSKFIKVTGQYSGEIMMIQASSIMLIHDNGSGCSIQFDGRETHVKESLEQIEAQLLRDEFAMRAMNGFISQYGSRDLDVLESSAYKIADAMLKERMK